MIRRPTRRAVGGWAIAVLFALGLAGPAGAQRSSLEPIVDTPSPATNDLVPGGARAVADRRLAASIAASARPSAFEIGTRTAQAALVECRRRGDFGTAGHGPLGMPIGHAVSRSDHCER